jgi:hypothetical protein
MRLRRNQDSLGGLERRLRNERPALDPHERDRLARMVRGESRHGAARPLLVLVSVVAVTATVAAFGGVSYAVQTVDQAVGQNSASQGTNLTDGISNSSSSDQYGVGACIENVNPHGDTIPPAGQTPPGTNPRSGQNPDGFYQVGSTDSSQVYVIDMATGYKFGPFPSGTVIKYTQASGNHLDTQKTIGSTTGQAGAVLVHLTGAGDAEVQSVNGGPISVCLVPKPPK